MEARQEGQEEVFWWFACTICGRAFPEVTRLKTHIRQVHRSTSAAYCLTLSEKPDLAPRITIKPCTPNQTKPKPILCEPVGEGRLKRKQRTDEDEGHADVRNRNASIKSPGPLEPSTSTLSSLVDIYEATEREGQSSDQSDGQASTNLTNVQTNSLMAFNPSAESTDPHFDVKPDMAALSRSIESRHFVPAPDSVDNFVVPSIVIKSEPSSPRTHKDMDNDSRNWKRKKGQRQQQPRKLCGTPLGSVYFCTVGIIKYRHFTDRTINYRCSICRASTRYFSEIKQHIKRTHEKRSYNCVACEARFESLSTLSSHLERDHTPGVNIWTCSACQIVLGREEMMVAHTRRMGAAHRVVQADDVMKSIAMKVIRTRRASAFGGGIKTATAAGLGKESSAKHRILYDCNLCHKTYPSQKRLSAHTLNSHQFHQDPLSLTDGHCHMTQ